MENQRKLEAEIRRVTELKSYGILDTAPEAQFDHITRLATLITGANSALIGLMDDKRHWFKSRIGIDAAEVARDFAICNDTFILQDAVVIPDLTKHEKYKSHPAVTGAMQLRFYAGCPIISAKGYALGTVCVFDRFVRHLDEAQIKALGVLSEQVSTLFEIRKASFDLRANLINLGVAAEKVLVEEQVLREFCEITSAVGRHVDWKFKTLIEFGARHLNLDTGFLALFGKDGLTVRHSVGTGEGTPKLGQLFAISAKQLFASGAADEVVLVDHESKEPPELHPLARALGFESWLATPITDDREFIGCVIFGSRIGRKNTLNSNDATFIRIIAQWFSMVIDRETRIKLVAHQQDVLRSSAQMAALGELAAGVAHEINNPLAVINTSVDLLRGLVSTGPRTFIELQQPIERIEATVDRIHRIVKGLKFSSQNASRADFAPMSVARLLADISELTRVRFARSAVGLRIDKPAGDLTIDCRAVEIGQVLVNLINNAYDAAHSVTAGWVKLVVLEDAETVSFRVSDNGPGIPVEIQEKIMQPFFTTKEVGKGTGLGLSISQGIVAQHRGQLYLDRKSIQTCFVVTLPKTHPKV